MSTIQIIQYLNHGILYFFIISGLGYLILLATSLPDIVKTFQEIEFGNINSLLKSKILPPITVIMPAYNESAGILDAVYGILKSDYINKYLIVVNDGSTDNTLDLLIKEFSMYKITPIIPQILKTKPVTGYYISDKQKNLIVIDKVNGRSADCINVGVNACRTPLFMTVDADTILEPDAMNRVLFSMLTQQHTLAVGGAIYILNGCVFKKGEILEKRISYQPILSLQTCEYLRAFLFGRAGWNVFEGALVFAGAFTLFERQAVLEVGGYETMNNAYDAEITLRLHYYLRSRKIPCNVHYTPAAAAWTDVPSDLKSFWKQRWTWQQGCLQSFLPYWIMLFNPKYGKVGLFTYPFYFFVEIFGAPIECSAYVFFILCWALGILVIKSVTLFVLVAWGLVTFISIATVLMSFVTFNKYRRVSNILWAFFVIFLETFGWRQYGVICRTVATLAYPFKKIVRPKRKIVAKLKND